MEKAQNDLGKVYIDTRQAFTDFLFVIERRHTIKNPSLSTRILNDVEEVHHAAIMAGDLQYMQKRGTILELYKEVRKDDIGG